MTTWLPFLGVLVAVGMAQSAGSPASSMRTLDKGVESGIESSRQVVARTPAEWTLLWKAHASDRSAPVVDFSREMAVAVFMGSRPTSGFAVEILGTDNQTGTLVVKYRETEPPAGVITAQVLTSPYHIVAVPQFTGEVRFLPLLGAPRG